MNIAPTTSNVARPSIQVPAASSWQAPCVPSLPTQPQGCDDTLDDDGDDDTPPGTYNPATVTDCLFQAFNFNRDFRTRTVPEFPHEAIRRAADVDDRRRITKRHNSRVKRAQSSEESQSATKWQGLVRRANKAAAQGRVQHLVSCLKVQYLPFGQAIGQSAPWWVNFYSFLFVVVVGFSQSYIMGGGGKQRNSNKRKRGRACWGLLHRVFVRWALLGCVAAGWEFSAPDAPGGGMLGFWSMPGADSGVYPRAVLGTRLAWARLRRRRAS